MFDPRLYKWPIINQKHSETGEVDSIHFGPQLSQDNIVDVVSTLADTIEVNEDATIIREPIRIPYVVGGGNRDSKPIKGV